MDRMKYKEEANEGRDVKRLKKSQVKPKRGEKVCCTFLYLIQSGKSRFKL